MRKKMEKQEKPYASVPKRWGSGLLDFRFLGHGGASVCSSKALGRDCGMFSLGVGDVTRLAFCWMTCFLRGLEGHQQKQPSGQRSLRGAVWLDWAGAGPGQGGVPF